MERRLDNVILLLPTPLLLPKEMFQAIKSFTTYQIVFLVILLTILVKFLGKRGSNPITTRVL